ncbi:MAG TPA: endonuclease Q family protein [Candidatus Magasanikbacteria bacterium]|nr:endonuclease Q family protein [Candidatus Magasanikbacteria bacterium]
MEKILDLHIHSRYSRACSRDLELPKIATMCLKKGIDIVATGDFTHPKWFEHIQKELQEVSDSGLFELKNEKNPTRFILGTEISCIYRDKEKCRRVHLLIFAPSFEAVEKINADFDNLGFNRKADGRPIIGLSAKKLLELILRADKRCFMVPAHAWTPWFAIFGSKSGYDSIKECFEELTPHITAIETGLSSDVVMNRRLCALDNIVLISNSDAHSLDKLGREANVFNFESEKEITYDNIVNILKTGDKKKFLYTIEFYPEEGKYQYDGHATCGVCLSPKQSKKEKNICPKCKKPLVIGVEHRVDDLADREAADIPWEKFIPYKYIVPLAEILSQILEVGPKSKKVVVEYEHLLQNIGSEFYILLKAGEQEIKKYTHYPELWLAINNMRTGRVGLQPGYDGVFGKIGLIGEKDVRKPIQEQLI